MGNLHRSAEKRAASPDDGPSSNPAKLRAYALSEQLKESSAPLFQKRMDDIISGEFSSGMMADWANDDKKLLTWRKLAKPHSKPRRSMKAKSVNRRTWIKAY
ncbi:hypothetical protein ACNKHM_12140 [Shigella sonnei]